MRSVIRFLNEKFGRLVEIHKQIVAVYPNVMNRQKEGRTDVHDEQTSGRPSLISEGILQEFEGEIHANRRVTIRQLHHVIPEVSKTTIHEAVTEKVGYRKLCASWVTKMLTDDHKGNGKIQVGYFGSSAVQSGPRALRFPLVSSPKETSPWEKVRRRR